ncbi:hypothetical protein HG531_012240 [Fusarium graminearum]|nr:hypothetical protein HG531_012240 [Fusarium graminearum]
MSGHVPSSWQDLPLMGEGGNLCPRLPEPVMSKRPASEVKSMTVEEDGIPDPLMVPEVAPALLKYENHQWACWSCRIKFFVAIKDLMPPPKLSKPKNRLAGIKDPAVRDFIIAAEERLAKAKSGKAPEEKPKCTYPTKFEDIDFSTATVMTTEEDFAAFLEEHPFGLKEPKEGCDEQASAVEDAAVSGGYLDGEGGTAWRIEMTDMVKQGRVPNSATENVQQRTLISIQQTADDITKQRDDREHVDKTDSCLAGHDVEGQVSKSEAENTRVGDVQMALHVVLGRTVRLEVKFQIIEGESSEVRERRDLDCLFQAAVVLQGSEVNLRLTLQRQLDFGLVKELVEPCQKFLMVSDLHRLVHDRDLRLVVEMEVWEPELQKRGHGMRLLVVQVQIDRLQSRS